MAQNALTRPDPRTILVIDGHPRGDSLSAAVARTYAQAAREAGATVELLVLRDLAFDPVLRAHRAVEQPLEPDLERAQRLIAAARHIVFVYPHWWGSAPALLKGFIDRTLTPGFAYRYRSEGPWWDKLLTGRTGEIWFLSDAPWFFFWFMYGNSGIRWLKWATLWFCGITPVAVNTIERVRFLSEAERVAALKRVASNAAARARAP